MRSHFPSRPGSAALRTLRHQSVHQTPPWPGLQLSSLSEQLSLERDLQSPGFSECVLTCLARWSLRMKRLLHTGHANRFSPVCVRRWRCSSSLRVNRFPQKSQLHTNGRSPVCHLWSETHVSEVGNTDMMRVASFEAIAKIYAIGQRETP